MCKNFAEKRAGTPRELQPTLLAALVRKMRSCLFLDVLHFPKGLRRRVCLPLPQWRTPPQLCVAPFGRRWTVKFKTETGLSRLSLFVVLAPAILCAQTTIPNQFNPLSASSPGFHLYGVSVFSGYYTQGVPFGVSVPVAVQPIDASYDVSVGASATFGWNRSGERSTVSITYSPSYFGSFRHSQYDTLGHSFSAVANRRLTTNWSVSASAAGTLSNLEQSFFAPTALSTVTAIPSTFDDLAAAILAGNFTNSQLASILTATPASQSPAQASLYGSRILNMAFGSTLSYTKSQRSSFQIGVAGARYQSLNAPANSNVNNNYLLPHSTSGSISLGWSYSMTPRTNFSASVLSSRSFSNLQDGYGTSMNFAVGRTMSRRWFLQGGIGAGMLLYARHTFPAPHAAQYLATGRVGFKTFAHTFLVAYNRTLGDPYAAGSGSTSGLVGSWTWKPPGSGWSVFSSGAYQRLSNPGLQNPSNWQGSAGVARALNAHMFMSAQYGYFKYPYALFSGSGLSQQGVSMALTWSPSAYR